MLRVFRLFFVCSLLVLIALQIICAQEHAPVLQPSAPEVEALRKKLGAQAAQISPLQQTLQRQTAVYSSTQEGSRSPSAQSELLEEADAPAAPASKKEAVDSPAAEFNDRITAPDLEEDERAERLTLKPESFMQGRYSFRPARGAGDAGRSRNVS